MIHYIRVSTSSKHYASTSILIYGALHKEYIEKQWFDHFVTNTIFEKKLILRLFRSKIIACIYVQYYRSISHASEQI